MYRALEDFKKSWSYERERTLAVLDAIPDSELTRNLGDHRTLGRLAWHMVESCVELPEHLGMAVDGPRMNAEGFIGSPVPATTKEIRDAYARASASVLERVSALAPDELLAEHAMYGETWTKGYALHILVVHQTHHRGQMTVLMRQAGLNVPEVYGPTRDGWAAIGKSAPEV
jgi:uncharacterized damage-inducible protein DinB